MQTIEMLVEVSELITPRIRRLILSTAEGTAIPDYAAGSHIELRVPGDARRPPFNRAYSLVRPSAGESRVEIAVQLEENGSGGSRWVHELRAGDRVNASAPRNNFPLVESATSSVLLAGGIGITPILCMARELAAAGKSYELAYAARQRDLAAYCNDIEGLDGHCWFDNGDPSRGMPLAEVVGAPSSHKHLYVCGPKPFITAVLGTARSLGWKERNLHCELFTGVLAAGEDRPFIVELANTGVSLEVPVGKSVMDVMEEAGLDPMFDCRRGECGVCVAKICDGDADHRDICLSARQRDGGSFCTCVSRARSERLVLEL